MNSPHKWPVTRKMFPFDGVIMGTTKPALNLEYGYIIASIYSYDKLLFTKFLTMSWGVMSNYTP